MRSTSTLAVDTTMGSATGRNVVAGHRHLLRELLASRTPIRKGTVISANYIGTNAAGTAALRN